MLSKTYSLMEGNDCRDDYSKKIGCGKKNIKTESWDLIIYFCNSHRAFHTATQK